MRLMWILSFQQIASDLNEFWGREINEKQINKIKHIPVNGRFFAAAE